MFLLNYSHPVMMIVIVAFLLIVLNLIIKLIRKSQPSNLPPGSLGWPVIGETLAYYRAGLDIERPQKFMEERKEKYKSQVFKTSLMGESVAVFCGPSGNKFLFSNENKLVTIWWPPAVRKLLGSCLITIPGDEGKMMRKTVVSHLSHHDFVSQYIKAIHSISQQHLSTHWQGKKELKVFDTVKLFTVELGCRHFMSFEDADQIAKLNALYDTFVKGVTSFPLNFPGTRFHKAMKATHSIKHVLQKIVRQRRVTLEACKKIRATKDDDLLSHLLLSPDENGKFMSEPLIINNLLVLLLGGRDTLSSAITVLIKYLAQLPEVYKNVLKEQNEIESPEDIQKMRYSWNVVSETFRLWPPALGALREAVADIDYQGYHIPKGWKLYWSAYMTHRDESLFPDNLSFDPSRYEGSGPTPFSYVPFGGGARMCLGRELARLVILIFLHNLITRFNWKLLIPDEMFEYDPNPIPAHGLPILLQSHHAA